MWGAQTVKQIEIFCAKNFNSKKMFSHVDFMDENKKINNTILHFQRHIMISRARYHWICQHRNPLFVRQMLFNLLANFFVEHIQNCRESLD